MQNKPREKNNIVANVLRDETRVEEAAPDIEEVTLTEEIVIEIDEAAEVVTAPASNVIAPKFVLDDHSVVQIQSMESMVKLPYDTFLETVLVEHPTRNNLTSVIDKAVADVTKQQQQQQQSDSIKSEETNEVLEKLRFNYRKMPNCVDFTKSNFFMKNAELIGGKGTGSGFKETVDYLPEGWRVKIFNEYKKFFFTPESIVLKSCTAVVEYLRLKYDLAQDDLKTLAGYLSINAKIFNRYLDELFDDCVVLE